MKRFFLAIAACAVLLSGIASADPVSNLYEVRVPVTSQGGQARRAGLATALQMVLVKISGSSDVLRDPGLKGPLATPERYVRQFRFQNDGRGAPLLWVLFDAPAIDQLLRGRGLPVWGADRPAVLLWIAIDDGSQRVSIGAGDTGLVARTANAAAFRRGVPVRFPALDREDQSRVRPADVWADAGNVLMAGAARYRSQVLLSGALLKQTDGNWRGRWTLRREGADPRHWQAAGSLESVVNAGIDGAADELAKTVLVAPTIGTGALSGAVLVRVSHVRTLEDYLRVANHLRGLSGVTTVQPLQVAGDQIVYQVSLQGAAQGLQQAIALGRVLVPERDPAAPAGEFSYRLTQ